MLLCGYHEVPIQTSFLGEAVFAIVTGIVATALVVLWSRFQNWLTFSKWEGEYVRIDIHEYQVPDTEEGRKGLEHEQLNCCMRKVTLKYLGKRTFETTAKYWPESPLAVGRIEFPLSAMVGTGLHAYNQVNGCGRYTMHLYEDKPHIVHVFFKGAIPRNDVRGYEVLVKREHLKKELLPAHLHDKFDWLLAEIDSSFVDDKLPERTT